MRRVLVIGGTGFIGEHLVATLLTRGADVSVIHNDPLSATRPSHVLYYQLDLTKPAWDVGHLVASHDAVAWLLPPTTVALQHLVNALSLLKPRHILYVSSALLYRGGSEPQAEEAPLNITNPYERGKLIEEQLLHTASLRYKFPLTIARLGNVYGDIKNQGIIGRAFHAVYRREPFGLNQGEQVRDFIFVDDVASALATLLLRVPEHFEIVNIGTGVGTSLRAAVVNIEMISGRKLTVKVQPGMSETERLIIDTDKLVRLVGAPRYTLPAGLRSTNERFRLWYDQEKYA